MTPLLLPSFGLFIGLPLLIWSANRFVVTATDLGDMLGLSKLAIGVLFLALGTSAPELAICLVAGFAAQPDIALGNILGSNIANICLALGFGGLLYGISIHRHNALFQLSGLLTSLIIVLPFFILGTINKLGGLLMVVVFFVFLLMLIKQPDTPLATDKPEPTIPKKPIWFEFVVLLFFLILLLLSSQAIIYSVETLAEISNISSIFISLTIVAISTSAPEIATTISCLKQRQAAVALGNVVGSNLYNLLLGLGVTAILHPITISTQVLWRDYLIMAFVSLILVVLLAVALFKPPTKHVTLNRLFGFILLCFYMIYLQRLVATGMYEV